ncbi:hypothetical protein [Spiroplasma endosymbiont of Amphibalanus improvisus]|uniref:hypothetical protein n=1 Tax=Spiroplasma endosymbiont of Amphibalanus improvisus TaxID=3066327 RepID=UPI00313E117A
MGRSLKINSILGKEFVELDLELSNNFKYENEVDFIKPPPMLDRKKNEKILNKINGPHTTLAIKFFFISELKNIFPADLIEILVKGFTNDVVDILNDGENVIQVKTDNNEITAIFKDEPKNKNFNDHIFFKITDILKLRVKIQKEFIKEFNNKDFPIITFGVSNDPSAKSKFVNSTIVAQDLPLAPTNSASLALKYARFCPIESGPILVFDSWFYNRLSPMVSKFLKYFITNQYNSKTISDQIKILDYIQEDFSYRVINQDIIDFYEKHIKQINSDILAEAEIFEYQIEIGQYGTNQNGE